MLFSVVIPSFNRRSMLPLALASVWSQTFTDYEVIVVDDGSTDGTLEYLSTVARPIRVLHQANLGPGAARNAGMAVASGDYVAFLDSDDLWFPWTLDVFARFIREHHCPAIVAGCIRQFSDESGVADVREAPARGRHFDDFLASAEIPILIGSSSIAVRRDAALACGGFTTHCINGEDHDLLLKMGVAHGFVLVMSPITLGWRRHAESETQSLEKSIQGANYLVDQERDGHYPGGWDRAPDRRAFITRGARPVSFACLRSGAVLAGLRLYRATFRWHLQMGRWAYLVAFPLSTMWAAVCVFVGYRS